MILKDAGNLYFSGELPVLPPEYKGESKLSRTDSTGFHMIKVNENEAP